MTQRRVLVVEDDSLGRAILHRVLSRHFVTLVAESVEEALPLLDAHDFYAVVSDRDLGAGRTGDWLLAEVGRRAPGCLRVLMSGDPGAEALAPAGCVFVRKPWDVEELIDLLVGGTP